MIDRHLAADHFDGVSARAHRVRLSVDSECLCIEGEAGAWRVPLGDVRWPERTRHGVRIAHLRGGGSLQALDAAQWDAWLRQAGIAESPVVTAQQSWRATAVAVVLLLLLAAAGYRWGVPWVARGLLATLPATVDRAIGDAAAQSLEQHWLAPSTLPEARQQQLRTSFAQAVERAWPADQRPAYELRFRASAKVGPASGPKHGLGANAFALPGGMIVVTDEMARLLQDRDEVMVGVLAHELGHVRHRHGMRQLVQVTLLGAAASLVWGDFSSLLAAAPALLGQLAYSRDFERDADDEAIALLQANGVAPAVMVELFERLAANQPNDRDSGGALGIALGSHPADAERVRRFREAE